MNKKSKITLDGTVIESLSNGMFKIKLDSINTTTIGYLSGKMRKASIKIIIGDRVKTELYISSPERARILYRY